MEHGQVVRISSAQSNAAQHLLTVICPALDIKVLPGELRKDQFFIGICFAEFASGSIELITLRVCPGALVQNLKEASIILKSIDGPQTCSMMPFIHHSRLSG